MEPKIEWLGHDGFRLTGEKVVYIDPISIETEPHNADILLLTHDHFDHFVLDDVNRVRNANTLVLVPEMLKDKVDGNVTIVHRGDKLAPLGVPIDVVPAYNVHPDRQNFHPKEYGGVGYIVTLNGKRIYHTGDTDAIPEMKGIQCDVMLVPISGKFVCTPDEAIQAVDLVKPGKAIPMHWGAFIGTWEDANTFKAKAGVPVEILGKTS